MQRSRTPIERKARCVDVWRAVSAALQLSLLWQEGWMAEGTVLPLWKNRCFGFKAESKATRKEESLCLLKIRSIS